MKRFLLLMVVVSFGYGGGVGASPHTKKRPLDLPVDRPGAGDEDEDAPEVIHFFGGQYEGDAFFFLLDVSGSMEGLKIDLLKEELHSSLDSLSPTSEFGIVAFSDHLRVYSQRPQRATPSAKSQAKVWVDALTAIGPTHMLSGAERILRIANKSRQQERIIVAVGDGLPSDPSVNATLDGILDANTDNLPFFTILIGYMVPAEQFMQDLADHTGGVYRVHEVE